MRVITVGRGHDNDVVINDYRVSRIHLQIVQSDNGNYSVVDLNSANGTFVNGQRITGEYHLQTNDSVIIGDTFLPWQTYFAPQSNGIINNEIPEQKQKRKPKRAIWFILVIGFSLLACGGITWKILYDKKQERIKIENEAKEEARLLQEENERRIAEEKRLQDEEITKLREESLISQRESEKKAKEEEKRAKEAERKAKEEEQKAKEAERKAKEAEQKAKDEIKFNKLKDEAYVIKDNGGNPKTIIEEMKKIAAKYPANKEMKDEIIKLEK